MQRIITYICLIKIPQLYRLLCSFGMHSQWPECSVCETYICRGCLKRVAWSNGAADDMPFDCDECWCAAHNKIIT